jgi:hypothetical protein
VLLLLAQDYHPQDWPIYRAVTQVITCDKETCNQVQKAGLRRRPQLLPWMPAVAFSLPHRTKLHANSFVLPLLRHEAQHMEQQVFQTLLRILQVAPEVRGTVLVQSGALTPTSRHLLREACQCSHQRLRQCPVTYAHLPAAMSLYGLTLWLPLASNLGEVGLMSLAVGTPVVCFATACAVELFAADFSDAVAAAVCHPPGYSELEMLACMLLQAPEPAQTALTGALEMLNSRRAQFDAVLASCVSTFRKVRK